MDKFTPIHNDVLEALIKQRLGSYEWQVLLAVIRKTYGYVDKEGKRKKTDFIASSQISLMTNIKRSHVSRAIGQLIRRGFLKKEGVQIGLSKDFYKLPNEVIPKLPNQVIITPPKITPTGSSKLPNQVTKELPNQVQKRTSRGNSELPNQVHTKEIYKESTTKDYISKDISSGPENQTPKTSKENSRKTKSEKPEKEPPQRDPRVTICREYWYEQFEAITKHPYPKNYGKDSNNWKWFLKLYHSVAWAKGLTDFYLKWDNDFVKKCGHSLDIFIKTLPSMFELGVTKSHWVKKHEQKGLEPASETIKKLFPNGV